MKRGTLLMRANRISIRLPKLAIPPEDVREKRQRMGDCIEYRVREITLTALNEAASLCMKGQRHSLKKLVSKIHSVTGNV